HAGKTPAVVLYFLAARLGGAGVRLFGRSDRIAAAQLDPIDLELVRDRIDEPLSHEGGLVASWRAIGRGWGLVGEAKMSDRAIGRHPIRSRQNPDRHMHHARCMRADIGLLIMEIAIIDREDDALGIDRGADLMHLLARMIGGDQMLAAVLDPFYRALEPLGRDTDQHVFGIELAADAEPAADMRFMNVNCARRRAEHAYQQFLIAMRDLGGAMEFEGVARRVVATDRAAGFERHPGMPPDRQFQFNDMRRLSERSVDVAIALADHRSFARMSWREFNRGRLRVDKRRQFFDLDGNEVGSI